MFLISDPIPEKNCNTLGHKRSLQSYDLLIQFWSQKKKEFSEKVCCSFSSDSQNKYLAKNIFALRFIKYYLLTCVFV